MEMLDGVVAVESAGISMDQIFTLLVAVVTVVFGGVLVLRQHQADGNAPEPMAEAWTQLLEQKDKQHKADLERVEAKVDEAIAAAAASEVKAKFAQDEAIKSKEAEGRCLVRLSEMQGQIDAMQKQISCLQDGR